MAPPVHTLRRCASMFAQDVLVPLHKGDIIKVYPDTVTSRDEQGSGASSRVADVPHYKLADGAGYVAAESACHRC